MADPQPVKRRRGCLFYAFCIATFGLVILAGLLLGILQTLRNYTEASPRSFPVVNISSNDAERLQRRVDLFRDNVRAARPSEPLSLSPNEINALIGTYPDLHVLKGKLYIESFDSNQVKAQISIPASQIPVGVFKFFKNRYLNGNAILNLAFKNGTLHLDIQSVTVKGKALPTRYMELIRGRNLAEGVNNDPRLSVGLNKLQSVQVKDGKIVIVPAPPPQ
jgi:hypothetical protein